MEEEIRRLTVSQPTDMWFGDLRNAYPSGHWDAFCKDYDFGASSKGGAFLLHEADTSGRKTEYLVMKVIVGKGDCMVTVDGRYSGTAHIVSGPLAFIPVSLLRKWGSRLDAGILCPEFTGTIIANPATRQWSADTFPLIVTVTEEKGGPYVRRADNDFHSSPSEQKPDRRSSKTERRTATPIKRSFRQQPSSRPEIEQKTPAQQEARWARNRIKARYLKERYGDQWTLSEHWNRGRCQPRVGWTITPPEADEFEDVADWQAFETKAIWLREQFGEAAMWDYWNEL